LSKETPEKRTPQNGEDNPYANILTEDEENEDEGSLTCGPDGKPLKTNVKPGRLPPFLKGAIKDWWFNKGKYAEIHDTLAAAGYYISKADLCLWSDIMWPDTIPTIDAFDPEFLAMTPQKQAIHLLWAKAVVTIRSITPYRPYAVKNLLDMASVAQRLAIAEAQVEKAEMDKLRAGGDVQKVIEAAKEQLMTEARRVLEQRPDLLQHVDQVCSVFEQAEENIRLLQ
jgi:hypothetical protein